ncbi:MAG: hypothetical protein FWD89_04500 [Firmicutes bacterium]|nr:hypothetical protein [Bacillota bacterium]
MSGIREAEKKADETVKRAEKEVLKIEEETKLEINKIKAESERKLSGETSKKSNKGNTEQKNGAAVSIDKKKITEASFFIMLELKKRWGI